MNLRDLLAAIHIPTRQSNAYEDALTGLPNRRALEQYLEHLFSRGEPFCLLMIDLDNFKAVNDLQGHRAGDEVLVRVVEQLSKMLRPEALLGRWGGDEFLVLAQGLSRSETRVLAKRLVQAAEVETEAKLNVGASVGMAVFPGDAAVPQELLAVADRAMYSAKRLGKGRWSESGGESPHPSRLNRDVFVGRHPELALLRRGLADPQSVGRMVLIRGASGSGKTTLVKRALGKMSGSTLIHLRCSHEMSNVPYAPLISALRAQPPPTGTMDELAGSFKRALARLMPSLLSQYLDRPPTEKQIVFEAFVELLRRWSLQTRLTFFLDDLQWVDRETRELLFYAHNFGELDRLLQILTLRSADNLPDSDALLAELARRGEIEIMELSALSRTETVQLIEQALQSSAIPTELINDAQRLSGGSPFLLMELLAEMIRTGNIVWNRTLGYTPFKFEGVHDLRLRLFLDHKLHRLDPEQTAVLRAVAVAGNEHDPATIERLIRLTPDRLQQALEEVQRLGLLGEPDARGRRAFVNDLYREMVYQSCPADLRCALHAELVEMLSGHADPALVAFHAQNAGNLVAAVDALIEAGGQALNRGICDAARSFAEQAAALFARLPADQQGAKRELRLLDCRGAAAWAVADFPGRRQASLRAAELLDELGQSREALLQRGMAAAALRLMGFCEESADEYACLAAGAEGEEKGRLLMNMADSLSRVGRSAEARVQIGRARILLRGRADCQASLDHKDMLVNAMERNYRAAVLFARRAAAKNASSDEWWCEHDLGEMLFHMGWLPQSARAYAEGLQRARRMPSLWGQACCLAGQVLVELNLMHLDRAAQSKEEVTRISDRTSDATLRLISDVMTVRLFLARGERERAEAALADFDNPGSLEWSYFSGLLAAECQEPEAALRFAEQTLERAGNNLRFLPNKSWVLLSEDDLRLLHLKALARLGRKDCFTEIARIAQQSLFHPAGARAFGVLAEQAFEDGDPDRAARLYLSGLRRPGGRWQMLEHWELIRRRAERLPDFRDAARRFAARCKMTYRP